MIKFVILLFGIWTVNVSEGAKLEIHRCVLANGTLSFQEKKCKNMISKNTPLPRKKQSKAISSKKSTYKKTKKTVYAKPRVIKYKKIAQVAPGDQSTQLITDRVKSYNISMLGLKKWSIFKRVYNNKLLHIKFLDEQAGGEISLLIDFIFPDNKNFSEKELTELVYLVGSQFANNSREGSVIPERMNISNANGIMATFTDVNNSNNKYRYTTKGAVFKGKWLIQFTLLSVNVDSFSHRFTIQNLFNSLQITQ